MERMAVARNNTFERSKIKIEKMIAEGMILLRIKYFKKSRSRITPEIRTELSISSSRKTGLQLPLFFKVLDDSPRHRFRHRCDDASDFRFVPDSTKGHLDKVAAGRASDRPRQRGFFPPLVARTRQRIGPLCFSRGW